MNIHKFTAALLDWSKQILVLLLVTFLISALIIQTYDINDVSMEPTFDSRGNRVLVFLTPYFFQAYPDYGEIIVIDSRVDRTRTAWDRILGSPLVTLFNREYHDYMWVKRVVGLPGDTIEYQNGKVLRNGQPLVEPYASEIIYRYFAATTVPDGHVFVMGDNRNRSRDSRVIGPVPVSNIQGRVIMRLFPLGKISIY